MTITKQTVAGKIAAYLRHDLSLAEPVSWAEDALMEGDFAEDEASTIADVVARLGVADVRAFGLAWEDCEQLQSVPGFEHEVIRTALRFAAETVRERELPLVNGR